MNEKDKSNGVEITEKGTVKFSWKMLIGLLAFMFAVGGWVFWMEAKSYPSEKGMTLDNKVAEIEKVMNTNNEQHKTINRKLNLLLDKLKVPRQGIED